jgi:cytochrome b561
VHITLYVAIFLMFLTGYLISTADNRGIDVFNWFTVPALGAFFENQEDIAGNIHEWLSYSLIGLAVIHLLAALKHHYVDKNDVLKRML